MTSWSYQSTNPCTVLVKEKQDGQSPISRDCPPPILQSSTETAASSQDQPDISSLGNIVGGKRRAKREAPHEDGVVDVVFDNGDGQHEFEEPVRIVEKRILVNISIAMDSGLGSSHQQIYQLQVAVPLPEEKSQKMSGEFYSYNVGAKDEAFVVVESPEKLLILNETSVTNNDLAPTTDDSSSTDTIDESFSMEFDDFITSSTSYPQLEGLKQLI